MTTKDPQEKTASRDGPHVNYGITTPKIRLIDEEGEMLGIFTRQAAIDMAIQACLDLVEISPNSDPPVCKIIDYGKFKYGNQKKKAEARKKQKIIEIKEIKIRPGIDENDYNIKLRSMLRFCEEGDKIKITLRFRGREIMHQERGVKVLERIRQDLEPYTKVEQHPKIEGKQMIMILAPK